MLYLLLAAWLLVGLLKMVWTFNVGGAPKQKSFVWALFVTSLTIVVAAPLQAAFIYGEGIPIAAVAWGLLLVQKHGFPIRASEARPLEPDGAGYAAMAGAERSRLG